MSSRSSPLRGIEVKLCGRQVAAMSKSDAAGEYNPKYNRRTVAGLLVQDREEATRKMSNQAEPAGGTRH
jgi:hypothetical protein